MENTFSDIFKKFYRNIAKETSSITDYLEKISEELKDIAESLNIGYIQMIVNSPANGFEYYGVMDRADLYKSPNGYDEEFGIGKTFVGEDWGIVQIEVCPQKGVIWNDDDEDDIDFLIQIIHDSCLKTRNHIFVKQAAVTDSLTGACNSAGILNFITELKDKCILDKYTALYLNIKNFSYINKRVGTKQSDSMLAKFSQLVREFLVKGELFGRVGGDTFFVLVENERCDECIKYLTTRRIIIELEKKSVEFNVLVRIGAYTIKADDNVDRVIQNSHTAFTYTRNPSAGDVVWYSDDMLRESVHDSEISNDFERAIKNNEFVVYYQPMIDLNSSKIIGAEALSRWIQNGVVVPPMEYIPVLERDGSIEELDFYMINNVCLQIKDWIARGIEPVGISVNLSRANILNKKLADRIIKVLSGHKVDSKYLEIEITELSGYEDFESLSEFINTMKDFGVKTSLDDFGTGYSSLTLLKGLNVDSIKLDKSFLEKIAEDEEEKDKSIVKNIISMVNELNMKVVAEGVENEIQVQFLKEANCHEAQGFMFDKPLPKDEFEKRLQGERIY